MSDVSIVMMAILSLSWLLSKSKLRKKVKVYMWTVIVLLAVVSVFFDPVVSYTKYGDYSDLYRFYYDMDIFKLRGFSAPEYLFQTPYSSIPIIKVFTYLVAITGNKRLFQLFACIITYGAISRLLLKIQDDYKLKDSLVSFAFLAFILMNDLSTVLGNMRMPVGMALFTLILYYDLRSEKKKWMYILMYFLLGLIHSIFFVFLALRILLFLCNKYSVMGICIATFAGGTLLNVVNSFNIGFGGIYVEQILLKIAYYTRDDIANHQDILFVIISISRYLLCAMLLFHNRKKNEALGNFFVHFNNFALISLFFGLGAYWNFHLFTRMGNFMVYVIVILLIEDRMQGINAGVDKIRCVTRKRGLFYYFQYAIIVINALYLCLSHHYQMMHFI